MNIHHYTDNPDADWQGEPGADDAAIARLLEWAGVELPTDYLDFLRTSNGGEGEFDVYPEYLRLWPIDTVLSANEGYQIQTYLPGFIGIGDSGGSDVVAIDLRAEGAFTLQAFLFSSLALEEAMFVASSVEGLFKSVKRRE
ncbi:SMI1/KNR4 family protein [Halomonas aquamarina]|uniref:SMI1/KNR4 family protein n=1 Tax=Vreelandella aquamarina TaxID=77097 RepID=A0ACC5VXP5_9GAMM|nr:SMI1/KNR4 family protein [Halomonas aquamarina]MBZ5488289.1 SMI1/KNR4 family protein [Halomonas aquamarina]